MADDQGMSITEAADVVRVVARDRLREAQAFEQIDRALATAVSSHSWIAILAQDKADLTADVDALIATKATLESAVSEARAHTERTIAQAETDAMGRSNQIRGEIETLEHHREDLRATIAREVADGQVAAFQRAASVQAELDAITASHRRTLRELTDHITDAQASLASTKQQFADLLEGAKKTAGSFSRE